MLYLYTIALVIYVLELSSKQHRPRREKTCPLGFPTKRVLNQSLRLNRLARNWISLVASVDLIHLKSRQQSCWWDCADAQAGLRLYCYKSPKTGFCSRGPNAMHERLENTGNMITQTQFLFAQSLQSICSVYADTQRVILLVAVFYIIQPDMRK